MSFFVFHRWAARRKLMQALNNVIKLFCNSFCWKKTLNRAHRKRKGNQKFRWGFACEWNQSNIETSWKSYKKKMLSNRNTQRKWKWIRNSMKEASEKYTISLPIKPHKRIAFLACLLYVYFMDFRKNECSVILGDGGRGEFYLPFHSYVSILLRNMQKYLQNQWNLTDERIETRLLDEFVEPFSTFVNSSESLE